MRLDEHNKCYQNKIAVWEYQYYPFSKYSQNYILSYNIYYVN